jgi:hypothetical protein
VPALEVWSPIFVQTKKLLKSMRDISLGLEIDQRQTGHGI